MNQTQFKRWSKVVKDSANKLGLQSFQIYTQFVKIEGDLAEGEQFVGYTEANTENRWANILLNKGYTGKLSNNDLDQNAKHEALELRFINIRRMLESYYNVDVVDSEIHKLIRVFEKII